MFCILNHESLLEEYFLADDPEYVSLLKLKVYVFDKSNIFHSVKAFQISRS